MVYMTESCTVKKADRKKKSIYLKYNTVLEKSFVEILECQKDEIVGPRSN